METDLLEGGDDRELSALFTAPAEGTTTVGGRRG
jgi:hypothetical protein